MRLAPPRWIAHRGGGSLAPENTLAGIRLAARLGFRAVEFDVMLSAEHMPFLIHDETLERTTNGRGRVAECSNADLLRLDAGQGEAVPTLAEASALCRALGLWANIEIKPSAGTDLVTAERVVQQTLVDWQGSAVPPLFSSFSVPALEVAQALAPDLPRALLQGRPKRGWGQLVRRLGAVALHCRGDAATPEVLAEAQALGVAVRCYTINEPRMAERLFALGVEALFTDRLDLFASDPPPGEREPTFFS